MDVTHTVVVFDEDGAKERVDKYPGYKKNRDINWESMKEEETPFSQEEDIKRALDYMGIKYIYSKGTEADDYIASIALDYKDKGDVVISSFDSDFFQLIDDKISILRYRGKASVLWNKAKFYSEFGFSPSFYSLYKAIVGDSADNIKGVKGMGKKRTEAFIREYEEKGSYFESILPGSLKQKLNEEKDRIRLNLDLIKLKKVEIDTLCNEFAFNKKRVEEGNSKVLESAGVFS